jgi:hypothetical protein
MHRPVYFLRDFFFIENIQGCVIMALRPTACRVCSASTAQPRFIPPSGYLCPPSAPSSESPWLRACAHLSQGFTTLVENSTPGRLYTLTQDQGSG